VRTVTFYSYKGGTGRTLLLANVAVLAARMGWKVVAIDVDLEAPGLTYKLFEQQPSRCDGLVGWLRDRFATGKAPLSLGDSLLDVDLTDPFEQGGWLKLMPAGRNPSLNYFQDLVGLRLEQRINDGAGVDSFVDLQDQVRAELAPDLLLLDARTGISSTNLITMRVMADDVIALSLDSREQLEGTRSVMRSLTPLNSLRTGQELRLHVVLARVAQRSAEVGAYTLTDHERKQIARVRGYLREPADPLRATLTIDRVHLLHSEPALVGGEFLTLASTRVLDATALHIDCLRIAEAVLGNEISDIAARVITETGDPEARERLMRFFAHADRNAEPRDAALASGGGLDLDHAPDLAERVDRLRAMASRSPALGPDLAKALSDLAAAQSAVGRRTDAVVSAERAVEIYDRLAATDAALLADLARALDDLCLRYSEVGRQNDALAPAERAVALYQDLVDADAAFAVDLARSLSDLGILQSLVDRRADALASTQRAVEILERLTASDPTTRSTLANALVSLANRHRDAGRQATALPPAEQAVEIYDTLAASEAVFLAGLANALHDLGGHYGRAGRWADAIASTRRAVSIYEQLATSDPAILGPLARALRDLGVHYGRVDRGAEAIAPCERAVEIYEGLAASEPVFQKYLADALNSMGARYYQAGLWADAVATTERAVNCYQELAASDPTFLRSLANALSNLGLRYERVDRLADAVGPSERALEIYEDLAASNPAFLDGLAASLNNPGLANDR